MTSFHQPRLASPWRVLPGRLTPPHPPATIPARTCPDVLRSSDGCTVLRRATVYIDLALTRRVNVSTPTIPRNRRVMPRPARTSGGTHRSPRTRSGTSTRKAPRKFQATRPLVALLSDRRTHVRRCKLQQQDKRTAPLLLSTNVCRAVSKGRARWG